jgi:hypothetical protein
VIGHIGGVPAEEIFPVLVGGAGAGLLLQLSSIVLRLRRPRRHYVVPMDLDEAKAEIERRWFVWTAAGLRVHPLTWTKREAARPRPLVERSEITTPHSLGLRVSRPNAQAEVVLYADGRTETAVRRPDGDATLHETAQLDSVEAFGALVDRVVELITWGGIGAAHRRSSPAPAPHPERGDHWILGFDGLSISR